MFPVKMDGVNYADFDIVVHYIPIFPPIRMQKCTHFVLHTDSSGNQRYFRSPGQCPLFPWL
jgi:hypothetical protein